MRIHWTEEEMWFVAAKLRELQLADPNLSDFRAAREAQTLVPVRQRNILSWNSVRLLEPVLAKLDKIKKKQSAAQAKSLEAPKIITASEPEPPIPVTPVLLTPDPAPVLPVAVAAVLEPRGGAEGPLVTALVNLIIQVIQGVTKGLGAPAPGAVPQVVEKVVEKIVRVEVPVPAPPPMLDMILKKRHEPRPDKQEGAEPPIVLIVGPKGFEQAQIISKTNSLKVHLKFFYAVGHSGFSSLRGKAKTAQYVLITAEAGTQPVLDIITEAGHQAQLIEGGQPKLIERIQAIAKANK